MCTWTCTLDVWGRCWLFDNGEGYILKSSVVYWLGCKSSRFTEGRPALRVLLELRLWGCQPIAGWVVI